MKLAALGGGVDDLGGLHDPVAWAPGVDLLVERLRPLAALARVVVVTDAAPGLGLMVAVAAFRLADEGAPVRVDLVIPWPGWPAARGGPVVAMHARAVTWYGRALVRADEVAWATGRPPLTRQDERRASHARDAMLVEGAALAWVCGGGGALARRVGVQVVDLGDELRGALLR